MAKLGAGQRVSCAPIAARLDVTPCTLPVSKTSSTPPSNSQSRSACCLYLPQNATAEQRERFENREGGTLTPSLCVDKAPSDIQSFAALVAESETTGQDWDMVFVGSLSGRAGIAPSADEAAQPLRFMVNAINNGQVAQFATFDRNGAVLQFS
jgi:hypothetical protein